MKAYKSAENNNKVREIVRDYMKNNPFGNIKYWSNREFEDSIEGRYGITCNMATKVREIIRADGYHDDMALDIWGFNKHTA